MCSFLGGHVMSNFSNSGSRPAMDQANHLEHCCKVFETAWTTGAPLRIEDCLATGIGVDDSVLFSRLLAIDVRWRRRSGESVSGDDYMSRFPNRRELIVAALSESSRS